MSKGKLRKFRPSRMYCYDLCNYQKVKFMIRLIKLDQIKFMNMGVKIITGTFENTLRLKCKRTMVSAVPQLLGVVMICQWQHLPDYIQEIATGYTTVYAFPTYVHIAQTVI